jgi:hypothetical protein
VSLANPVFQPRYVAYAYSRGENPDDMLVVDQREWPGGVMCGFILWIAEQWREWEVETGHVGPHWDECHVAFDAWLEARYGERIGAAGQE